jgi:hypothetical protein
MLPIVALSLVKPSTSSPDWKPAVIETVPEGSAVLSGSATVRPVSTAIGVCSNDAVVPALAVSTGELRLRSTPDVPSEVTAKLLASLPSSCNVTLPSEPVTVIKVPFCVSVPSLPTCVRSMVSFDKAKPDIVPDSVVELLVLIRSVS